MSLKCQPEQCSVSRLMYENARYARQVASSRAMRQSDFSGPVVYLVNPLPAACSRNGWALRMYHHTE
jgi:hypothetical protein